VREMLGRCVDTHGAILAGDAVRGS
jgi:hypothetical protein